MLRSIVSLIPALTLLIVAGLASATPVDSSITALITDRSAIPVSDQFFLPANQSALTPAGDLYFATQLSAFFRQNLATGARTRLLQANDPMPGLAGATLWRIGAGLRSNGAGHVVMVNNYSTPGISEPNGIFVFDGSSYRKIATAGEATPGVAGHVFIAFGLPLINDAGDVAFQAILDPGGAGMNSLFVYRRNGPPVAIATVGDPSPTGGKYSVFYQILGLNNAGQVAFVADLDGAPNRALFLYTPGSGIQTVVKRNDPTPGIPDGAFALNSSATNNYFLNASGKIAFLSNVLNNPNGISAGIWIGSGTAAPQKLIAVNDPTGSDIGGVCSGSLGVFGYNDDASVLYPCDITGGTASGALFVGTLGSPAQVVVRQGQLLPGSAGDRFEVGAAARPVLNQSGKVVILAKLSGGTHPYGLLLGTAGADPQVIALEGEPTPLGGSFGFAGRASITPMLNSAGQVVFTADALGPNLTAMFSWKQGEAVRSVVSTADALPRGANLSIYPIRQTTGVSDEAVLFTACPAGGKCTVYLKSNNPGVGNLRRIVTDFETIPGLGVIAAVGQRLLNDNEEVAFQANLIVDSGPYPASCIYLSRPGAALQRLVMSGDVLGDGSTLAGFLNIGASLNLRSQVVFTASTAGPSGAGIYLAAPDGTRKVVRAGENCGASVCQSFASGPVLDASGQVGFVSNMGAGGQALLIGSGAAPPAIIAKAGDIDPDGLSIGNFANVLFSGSGRFTFLTGAGTSQRILRADQSGIVRIVRYNDPAPGGGAFANFRSILAINNAGQVAFQSAILDPVSPSGIFVGDGATLTARLREGQALPGGGAAGFASGAIALSEAGELAIYLANITGSGIAPWSEARLLTSGADSALRAVAATGQPAQGTGSDFGVLAPMNGPIYNSANHLFFGAILMRGPTSYGFFRYDPPKK